MKPLKAKDLIVNVALEMNIPVSVVNEIILSYWKEVRESLSLLVAPRVHVSNLGDFVIKHWKIEKEKEKIKAIIENFPECKKREIAVPYLNNKLVLMEQVDDKRKDEEERRNFLKIHKKTLSNVKKTISKQKTNIGRNQK